MQNKTFDCIICKVPKETLYKCPSCYSKYCSAKCCKEHKETCEGKKVKE